MIKAFVRAGIGVAAIVFGAVVACLLRNTMLEVKQLPAAPPVPCCKGCAEFFECSAASPCCAHDKDDDPSAWN